MKKTLLTLSLLLTLLVPKVHAQCGGTTTNTVKPTSIGLIIYSNEVETVWNALRLANYSKSQGDTVSIFLLGKGVELDSISKKDKNVKEQTDLFLNNGGSILGCGTCLQSRKINEPQVCKFSSLQGLYELIRKNKIVLTF
jgi:uncharacterized protein involved in oxidation of intracellular sulfur